MGLLILFTTTNNLYATTNPIVTGSTDRILLSAVVGYNQEELITEENTFLEQINPMPLSHYLTSAIGVQHLPSYIYNKQKYVEFSTPTAGGSSLPKPIITTNYKPQTIYKNKERFSITEYIVQNGDTLSAIAKKFGLKLNTILWANNLTSRSYIKPGQKLIILPTDGITYKIKKGDTISSIANRYKTDINKIITYNNISNPSKLKLGQKIIIPEAKPIKTHTQSKTNKTRYQNLRKIKNWLTPKNKIVKSRGKLLWPTKGYYITQYFSFRHTGLDIDGITDDPIYAAADGVVIESRWGRGYGLFIMIDHGGGMKTLYAHNSRNLVKKGQRVKKGQVISLMGSTGWSTGSHVHFEVRINGRYRNPLSYLAR